LTGSNNHDLIAIGGADIRSQWFWGVDKRVGVAVIYKLGL